MATDPNDRELSLVDLAPERLTFWDTAYGGDGARHEWRMVSDLGLEDMGSLRRIQDELARASAAVNKPHSTAEELDGIAQKLAAGLDAFLHLVLPSMPAERLRAIPLRGKQHMLQWWQARQATDQQEVLNVPLGEAARATRPSKRSRGSSPATA